MRKIEMEMNKTVRLFLAGRGDLTRTLDNTTITRNDKTGAVDVRLWGHLIACVWPSDESPLVWLSSCGYRTNTTKSRLNALLSEFSPGKGVYQKARVWYVAAYASKNAVPFVDGMVI